MLSRIKISIIFLLFLLHCSLFAGISVTSKIDTSLATIGDQVTLKINVVYPNENTTISFPNLNDEMQKFSVLSKTDQKPEKIASGFEKIFQMKIAVFDTGKIEIPSLTVHTQVDTNDALMFKTVPHIVNVISVLPPDENVQPKDIKMPFPLPTILPWDYFLFILILLAIAGIWYFLYAKWKKDHPIVEFNEKYLDPPHIIALKKLTAIMADPFDTEKEIIKTYTAISYIVREYLEGRYFVRALEMPTRDIMESFSELEIDPSIALSLQDLLNRLDVIKFANQLPEVSEKDNIIEIAKEIIQKTKVDNFLSQRSGLTDIKESLGK